MDCNEKICREAIAFAEGKINRKIVFAFLQGSQNYRLDTPSSDQDIKAFCIPSFEDFYQQKQVSLTIDYPHGQVTIHDLRMLPKLLEKMNPTYLESFHSLYSFVRNESGVLEMGKSILSPALFDELFRSNFDTWVRAAVSYFQKKQNEMHKATPNRAPVIAQYGYDVKSASHAFRMHYLIHGLIDVGGEAVSNPFATYQKLLRFEGDSSTRNQILKIKNGECPEESILPELEQQEKELMEILDAHQNKTKKNPLPNLESLEEEIYRFTRNYFGFKQ
ncbi:MAG: nucleotidyltransferase domain-containing protein [Candidatus Enteromonas sp.]|nr:nucleotidyltransferase domain-containing protein [Candidatus Enteromonas sp.]